MIQLNTAMNAFMNNDVLWFADDDGTILCGHVTNVVGVKEPPNSYVAHMDHIKTDPAAPTMVRWTESKQLCDLYQTKIGAIVGYETSKLRIYKNQIKTADDLIAFMLTHDITNSQIARKAAIEAAIRLNIASKIPEREKPTV